MAQVNVSCAPVDIDRVLMPLVVTDAQLEKGLGILEAERAQLPAG